MFNECDNANDHYPIGRVSIMYHSERRSGGNICQYKVSGKEFCYKLGIKRMLETRINFELQNEQFDKLLYKFVQRRPDPAPKIMISIKLDIPALVLDR